MPAVVTLCHQQVSPWPFKDPACGTKKAEWCCFKPLQALQILSCCFLTGPTQPATACLTLWLLMSESTCSLSLSSLCLLLSSSFSSPPNPCHLSYLQQWVKMRGNKGLSAIHLHLIFFCSVTHTFLTTVLILSSCKTVDRTSTFLCLSTP